MPTLFNQKVLSTVVNDITQTHYSDPAYDALLGNAEKYLAEVKASGVSGGSATLTLSLETSNDGVTWFVRDATLINAQSIVGGKVQFASEIFDGGAIPLSGCYARFGCKLGGAGSNAYLELWVEGRDGA